MVTPPCPFCASENTRLRGMFRRWVQCRSCGARGPRCDNVSGFPEDADFGARRMWASVRNVHRIERMEDDG